MINQEIYKLLYEYHRGGYKSYPSFEEWFDKFEIQNMKPEEIEAEYKFALAAKERTTEYKKLVQENSYVLMNNDITEEEIEDVMSNEIISINMDGEIERLLFIIETLKVFHIYEPNIKINDIETLGGGFYEDGFIYGYNININNGDKYRIELGKFKNEPEDESIRLIIEPSSNEELMNRQLDMLKKFTGFYNNNSIMECIKEIENSLNKKKHF